MDLTPLYPILQNLGPWGYLVVAAIVLIQWRRGQGANPFAPKPVSPVSPPADPAKPADPKVDPLLLPNHPLLAALLRRLLQAQAAGQVVIEAGPPAAAGEAQALAPDLPVEVLVAQRRAIDDEIARQRGDHQARLKLLDQFAPLVTMTPAP